MASTRLKTGLSQEERQPCKNAIDGGSGSIEVIAVIYDGRSPSRARNTRWSDARTEVGGWVRLPTGATGGNIREKKDKPRQKEGRRQHIINIIGRQPDEELTGFGPESPTKQPPRFCHKIIAIKICPWTRQKGRQHQYQDHISLGGSGQGIASPGPTG